MPAHKLPDKNFNWTPQLAYAVGLIVTDGCLLNDGRHVVIRSVDKQLLYTFKQCLGAYNNKISETPHNNLDGCARKKAYRVYISKAQFYRWLIKIGIMPAKTHVIGRIDIPDKYFRDFLRGHLDGDGSIVTYKDFYNSHKNPKYVYARLWLKFVSASETHIKWLREKISNLIAVRGHLSVYNAKRRNAQPIWQLKFSKKDSINILRFMYYSPYVPCLKRKRDKAEMFLSQYATANISREVHNSHY